MYFSSPFSLRKMKFVQRFKHISTFFFYQPCKSISFPSLTAKHFIYIRFYPKNSYPIIRMEHGLADTMATMAHKNSFFGLKIICTRPINQMTWCYLDIDEIALWLGILWSLKHILFKKKKNKIFPQFTMDHKFCKDSIEFRFAEFLSLFFPSTMSRILCYDWIIVVVSGAGFNWFSFKVAAEQLLILRF